MLSEFSPRVSKTISSLYLAENRASEISRFPTCTKNIDIGAIARSYRLESTSRSQRYRASDSLVFAISHVANAKFFFQRNDLVNRRRSLNRIFKKMRVIRGFIGRFATKTLGTRRGRDQIRGDFSSRRRGFAFSIFFFSSLSTDEREASSVASFRPRKLRESIISSTLQYGGVNARATGRHSYSFV